MQAHALTLLNTPTTQTQGVQQAQGSEAKPTRRPAQGVPSFEQRLREGLARRSSSGGRQDDGPSESATNESARASEREMPKGAQEEAPDPVVSSEQLQAEVSESAIVEPPSGEQAPVDPDLHAEAPQESDSSAPVAPVADAPVEGVPDAHQSETVIRPGPPLRATTPQAIDEDVNQPSNDEPEGVSAGEPSESDVPSTKKPEAEAGQNQARALLDRLANATRPAVGHDTRSSIQGAEHASIELPESAAPSHEQSQNAEAASIESSQAERASSGVFGGAPRSSAQEASGAVAQRDPAPSGDPAQPSDTPRPTPQRSQALPRDVAPRERAESVSSTRQPTPLKTPDTLFSIERVPQHAAASTRPITLGSKPPASQTIQSSVSNEPTAVVARGLSAAVLQKGGSLTMRLIPETLGSVRIDLSMDRGSVSVRIEAGTVAAQGLLNEGLPMLRHSLESKGLAVERMSVHLLPQAHAAPSAGSFSNDTTGGQPGNADQQRSLAQEHDAGQGASRGRDQHQQERDPAHARSPESTTLDVEHMSFDPDFRLALNTLG